MLAQAALLVLTATSLLPFTHFLLCPLSHPFPWDRSSSDRDFYCWSTTEIRPLAFLEVAVTQGTGTKSSAEHLRVAGLVTTK